MALIYGGRLEIMYIIKSILRAIELGHIDKGMIDVDMFSKHLYTRYYPDPDLLIRTSGELRLSNFLLWQLSYTEMYVTPKLWSDFTKKDLYAAVEEYGRRQRRYGAVESIKRTLRRLNRPQLFLCGSKRSCHSLFGAGRRE